MATKAAAILVVGSVKENRDHLAALLESGGYEVRQATSFVNAEALLHSSGPFDLVICDFAVADVGEITSVHDYSRRWPDIPVIITAPVPEHSQVQLALHDDAYYYVFKMFDRAQLLATVHYALQTRRIALANREYEGKLELLVATRSHELQATQSKLAQSQDLVLEVLGATLDLRDGDIQAHSRRVTEFSMIMARAMRLPEEQVQLIARGAFLHDIGKLAIPDSILHKSGPLTAEEMTVVRQHCYTAYALMKKVPFLQEAAEIVYAHHERYDGSGYPRGLKGDQIPLGARIFAIADTVDAMTSERPYRHALPIAAARNEIARWSGRLFDPIVAEVFLSLPDEALLDPRHLNETHFAFAYATVEAGV